MSEDELEQQMAVAEALQAQLGQMERQYEQLQEYVSEVRQTRQAIDRLGEVDDDHEIMVPLGAGAFVHARLPKLERVLAPLGRGVLAEEAPDKALKRLERREQEASEAAEKLSENMSRLSAQLEQLVAQLQATGQGGPPSPGPTGQPGQPGPPGPPGGPGAPGTPDAPGALEE